MELSYLLMPFVALVFLLVARMLAYPLQKAIWWRREKTRKAASCGNASGAKQPESRSITHRLLIAFAGLKQTHSATNQTRSKHRVSARDERSGGH